MFIWYMDDNENVRLREIDSTGRGLFLHQFPNFVVNLLPLQQFRVAGFEIDGVAGRWQCLLAAAQVLGNHRGDGRHNLVHVSRTSLLHRNHLKAN